MSEGGLELSAPGMPSGTSEDAEPRTDQAVRVPGSQPGDIREHPDTPAPVSREVSADAYDGPLSALRLRSAASASGMTSNTVVACGWLFDLDSSPLGLPFRRVRRRAVKGPPLLPSLGLCSVLRSSRRRAER